MKQIDKGYSLYLYYNPKINEQDSPRTFRYPVNLNLPQT